MLAPYHRQGGAGTWYEKCTTAAETSAKAATITNYVLTRGSVVSLTFYYANTADAITLNISSTGAKTVYRGDSAVSATNPLKWTSGETLTFMYDGSYYRYISSSLATYTQTLTLSSSFKNYNNNSENAPIFKVSGQVCDISGVIAPTSTIAGSNTRTKICDLPTGYEPAIQIVQVCQGSGNARWTCEISKGSTEVTFSRYCNTASASNSYNNCDSNQWLPFHVTYII